MNVRYSPNSLCMDMNEQTKHPVWSWVFVSIEKCKDSL